MQTALSEFNVTQTDIQKYHSNLVKKQKLILSGEEFLNQNAHYSEQIKWTDFSKTKDIAISRYYRKIMLNSTLLIYYIFENYKEKIDLKTMEPFLVANLALSPSSVIKDTLEKDPNINKYIINQTKVKSMGLSFDMSIDTWTRDPKFEKPLFKHLPTNSTRVGIVKLDTSLANNGFVAYHKGIEAGARICASSHTAPSTSLFNTQPLHDKQIHFT